MKRTVLIFVIAGLVLITTGLWYIKLSGTTGYIDLLHFGVIFMVVVFALFAGYKRLTSVIRGEPAEDELSKKILQKTASISYYISLYIWIFLIFLKNRVSFETEELLGTGILAMAATYGIVWLILYFRGKKYE